MHFSWGRVERIFLHPDFFPIPSIRVCHVASFCLSQHVRHVSWYEGNVRPDAPQSIICTTHCSSGPALTNCQFCLPAWVKTFSGIVLCDLGQETVILVVISGLWSKSSPGKKCACENVPLNWTSFFSITFHMNAKMRFYDRQKTSRPNCSLATWRSATGIFLSARTAAHFQLFRVILI